MGYDGVDNAIGGLNEIELWLKVMESNHEEMRYTQDDIIQGQKQISTVVEKLLVYMESSRIGQCPWFEYEGHKKKWCQVRIIWWQYGSGKALYLVENCIIWQSCWNCLIH
jgi:hypothetical protein